MIYPSSENTYIYPSANALDGGQVNTEQNLALILKSIAYQSYVIKEEGVDSFLVSGSSGDITVTGGKAAIDGHFISVSESLTLPASSRPGTIILKLLKDGTGNAVGDIGGECHGVGVDIVDSTSGLTDYIILGTCTSSSITPNDNRYAAFDLTLISYNSAPASDAFIKNKNTLSSGTQTIGTSLNFNNGTTNVLTIDKSNGNLVTNGSITAVGNINTIGNLNVSNEIWAKSLDIRSGGNLKISLDNNGNIDATGNIVTHSQIQVKQGASTKFTVDNNGNVSTQGDISVTGDLTSPGDEVNVNKKISCGQTSPVKKIIIDGPGNTIEGRNESEIATNAYFVIKTGIGNPSTQIGFLRRNISISPIAAYRDSQPLPWHIPSSDFTFYAGYDGGGGGEAHSAIFEPPVLVDEEETPDVSYYALLGTNDKPWKDLYITDDSIDFTKLDISSTKSLKDILIAIIAKLPNS